MRTRVHIADDHTLVAEGLRAGLSRSFEITGVSATAADTIAQVGELTPDVLLLDISLGPTNGLKLIRPLLAAHPKLRIVVVTMHSDALLAETAFDVGAHGFVPKDAGTADLVSAIRAVAAGDRYLSASVAPHHDDASPPPSLTTGLTPRQTEVLALIAQGLSGEAIGAALGVAVPTVAFHRQRIREALGLKTEWELVRYAILAKANARR